MPPLCVKNDQLLQSWVRFATLVDLGVYVGSEGTCTASYYQHDTTHSVLWSSSYERLKFESERRRRRKRYIHTCERRWSRGSEPNSSSPRRFLQPRVVPQSALCGLCLLNEHGMLSEVCKIYYLHYQLL